MIFLKKRLLFSAGRHSVLALICLWQSLLRRRAAQLVECPQGTAGT